MCISYVCKYIYIYTYIRDSLMVSKERVWEYTHDTAQEKGCENIHTRLVAYDAGVSLYY